MTDYPPVIVLLITYRRLPLALATVRSIKEKLIYPNIGFHIADDGSGGDHIQSLIDEIGPTYSITVSDAERGGVGRSMNLGMTACLERADHWLHLEDDWVLPKPLDLSSCVQLLNDDPTVGMIRMGCLPAAMKGVTFSGAGRIWWRLEKLCDPYVFCGNPSLRHRRFYEAYGDYPVGLPPGQTEMSYCSIFNYSPGSDIAWPAWLSWDDAWQHIGDHQSFKWWMEGEAAKTAEECAAIFEEMDTNG